MSRTRSEHTCHTLLVRHDRAEHRVVRHAKTNYHMTTCCSYNCASPCTAAVNIHPCGLFLGEHCYLFLSNDSASGGSRLATEWLPSGHRIVRESASSLRSPTKAVKRYLQGTMHSCRHTCPLLRLTLQGDRSREHVSRVQDTTSGNGSATSPAPEVRFEIFYNKLKPAWLFPGQCPARQAKAGIITVEDFPDSSCCRSGHPHDVAKVTSTEPGRQFLQDKADKHTRSTSSIWLQKKVSRHVITGRGS